ncbi:unnamed protein product [Rangifer tarandus platyrhynchus]|uniref:Uncharacterized protein n=2 Tax=Rangifer tarandus platyrhynchus TaxID=3082113 RepID=A0ACB0F8D5_RANTA|nr:unnamed protein product [Rangifer tarandus platyrhynchus]CAI9709337.1 unnamed protein product [Rangifer tarandus platyrhynchus]
MRVQERRGAKNRARAGAGEGRAVGRCRGSTSSPKLRSDFPPASAVTHITNNQSSNRLCRKKVKMTAGAASDADGN